MSESSRASMWKMTAIGMAIAAVTAVVTGLVVANRTAPPTPVARVEAPPVAAPAPAKAAPAPLPTTAKAAPTPEPPTAKAAPTPVPTPAPPPVATKSGVPPTDVVAACNRHAEAQAGSAPREGKDKVLDVGKDAGIGALGGAAVGAIGGAIADGGKGAGKGALIGGLIGAGGGTLYGMWDNKKNDERFRAAYGECMRVKGYTG